MKQKGRINMGSLSLHGFKPNTQMIQRTLLILFTFIWMSVFSQKQDYYLVKGDTVKKRPHLSIGTRHFGIGFGNFQKYSGLRFSANDRDTLNNGISLNISSFKNGEKQTNGFEFSLLFSYLKQLNGINICPFISDIRGGNGFSFSGVISDGYRFNGIQLSGGISKTYFVNGICMSGISNAIYQQKGLLVSGVVAIVDSISKGVAISGVYQKTGDFRGVCIAPINTTKSGRGLQIGLFNEALKMQGVQIGLININRRKKHFRVMPIINFSFRKLD